MTTLTHPGDALSRSSRVLYVVVLGALVALGPFTIDLYLPAFPVVAEEFAGSETLIQLTLTATMIGFGLGQLVVGPWSDTVGRRLPLILATTVHVGASLGVAFSPDITWLLVFRVLQGVGASGGGVVAMATVRDLFGGQPLVRMLSRLALVTSLAPILAPVIGSQLLVLLDWRGLFLALAAYGVLVLVLASTLITETLPPERRRVRGHSTMAQRYRAVLSDRVFIGVALIAGLMFSGLFAYLSASSFLFQDVYGFDAQQYGILFAVNSIGLALSSQVASRLMRRFAPARILAVSLPIMALAGVTAAAAAALDLGLGPVVVGTFVFLSCAGLSFPCIQVTALAPHGAEAGTAAALLGAINFGVASLSAPLIGIFGTESAIPMGLVMAGALTLATLLLWIVVRPLRARRIDDESAELAVAAH
ncbi:multidrug effflux MFS transporter [Pseudolysinimonas yzui]|uniref:Putative multidrug resistance transporter, Bcr/CflA family protein n=1 Tax=Pseudolysinimonas yzui TaxID=2708254 RepID=A0A8J3M0F9_9MICO|nr:multidrug effflux MFS transporter [Pseudolysinimonas yzui]GHF14237.1 putative multidrug resistance transporter, Bcr/CflA family protein [Pseudolysinimonas yzui]